MSTYTNITKQVVHDPVNLGGVLYDFKQRTAVYQFKTAAGANNSLTAIVNAGGKIIGKTKHEDGSISIKVWDKTNNIVYTVLINNALLSKATKYSNLSIIDELNDVAISYIPPKNPESNSYNFSEITTAQNKIIDSLEQCTKSLNDTIISNNVLLNPKMTENNTNNQSDNQNFIPSSLQDLEIIAAGKLVNFGVNSAIALPAIKTVLYLSEKLKLAKTTALLNDTLKISHGITNLAYEYANKITFGLFRRLSTPFRVAFDALASTFSRSAAARNTARLNYIMKGFGIPEFINNWRSNGFKSAIKTGTDGARYKFDRTGRILSYWNDIGEVMNKSKLGKKIVEVVSKISSSAIVSIIPRATNIGGWVSIGASIFAKPIGDVVTQTTGNETAGKTTSAAISGLGKGAAVGCLTSIAVSALPVAAAAAGASAATLATIASVTAFIPGPGWIIAGAALAYGAYAIYKANQKSQV